MAKIWSKKSSKPLGKNFLLARKEWMGGDMSEEM